MVDSGAWLEEVAMSCTSTLAHLNRKAQQTKVISDGDQVMSEICMGYLYLLHMASSEGILQGRSVGNTINRTIH